MCLNLHTALASGIFGLRDVITFTSLPQIVLFASALLGGGSGPGRRVHSASGADQCATAARHNTRVNISYDRSMRHSERASKHSCTFVLATNGFWFLLIVFFCPFMSRDEKGLSSSWSHHHRLLWPSLCLNLCLMLVMLEWIPAKRAPEFATGFQPDNLRCLGNRGRGGSERMRSTLDFREK